VSGRHRRPEPETDPAPDTAARPEPVVSALDAQPGWSGGILGSAAARQATASTTVRPSARRARAAERAHRRAAARRRAMLVGGVLALVVVLVGAVGLVLRGSGDEPTTAITETQRQRTLVMLVTGSDGVASASALTGVPARADATPDADLVLVPSGLVVDVAGAGSVPYGETTTLSEPAAPAEALTDLLGVRVDGVWRLTTDGLAALVDAVGGVRAAVDVDVVRTDDQGNQVIVVRAGTQQLDGAAAAAYATYRAEGEPDQARLARFDEVLTGVLGALPESQPSIADVLDGLGDASTSTLAGEQLAVTVGRLRVAVAAEAVASDVLPVSDLDTGGTVPTYGIDSGQASAMMRARFPGALLTDPAGESLRVLVENGVGTPGLVEAARAKLVAAGFRFTNGGNAAQFTDDPSTVIVPDGTQQSVRRGQRVAAALGLPDSAIAASNRGQTVADVIVILGSDFSP